MSQEFLAELGVPIYSGAQAGMQNRWSACNFFDKVVFAQASVNPVYWPGGGHARPVPGLVPSELWDGVAALAGHLLLWKADRLKWCDLNDFSMWIPVAQTATSTRATLAGPYIHPAKGSNTDWLYFKESDRPFVVGQYVRVDVFPDDPQRATYNFYLVAAVADTAGLSSESIDTSVTLSVQSSHRIFTKAFVDWPIGSKLIINGRPSAAVVRATGGKTSLVLTLGAASQPVPLPGQTFVVNLSDNPTGIKVGDVVSFGDVGVDLFKVKHVGFSMTLERLNIGTNRSAAGFVFASGAAMVTQPFIEVTFASPTVTVKPAATITAQGAVKLTGLGLTGESAIGAEIAKGNVVATVDANEAGEDVNAGSAINGPIYAIVELDEYGVILKEKSIQTMQYVGQGNGVFFIRPELEDVGPIARNAWARIDTSSIVFCGESEIYQYSGGKNIQAVAQEATKEFFAELDLDRRDEVIFYHYKTLDQVWVAYPSLKSAGTRVLIYNYREGSAVLDDYSSAIGTLTAIGAVHWELAPTWASLSDTQHWNTETKRWREYVDSGLQRYTLLACSADLPTIGDAGESGTDGVPRLLMHGRVFSRASGTNCEPQAYLALAETTDYDFKDPARIKYVDTLLLNIEIRPQAGTVVTRPLNLYAQFGCRDNLDSDIRWTAAARVEVSGNGMRETKVNLRGYGRFVRVRFFSQEIGIQWRIAGFELIARPGGTL